MRIVVRYPSLIRGVLACAAVLVFAFAETPKPIPTRPSRPEDSAKLRRFLRDYFKDPYGTGSSYDNHDARYSSAFVDLNGDGVQEVIVYVTSPSLCGSGGCVTLILASAGANYKIVTAVTITRAPILVFSNSSNGWRNIGVWVQGGSILPGYEAELRFNGKTYPSNPSMPPARQITGHPPGRVVISSALGDTPLYP